MAHQQPASTKGGEQSGDRSGSDVIWLLPILLGVGLILGAVNNQPIKLSNQVVPEIPAPGGLGARLLVGGVGLVLLLVGLAGLLHERLRVHMQSHPSIVSRRWAKTVPPLVTALLTSGLGIAINLATEWKRNPWAWALVVALTVASAIAAAAIANRSDEGRQAAGSVTSFDKQIKSRSGQLSTSGSVVSSGVVMRHIRIGADGTRVETEYFSEELARVAIRQDLPTGQTTPEVDD